MQSYSLYFIYSHASFLIVALVIDGRKENNVFFFKLQ